MPDEWPVVAEGESSRGELWYLTAGGSAADYESMLKVVYPDGRWGQGGMQGPALYPGQLLNSYAGRGDDGPLWVIVRSDPRVVRVRLQSEQGEESELLACAHDQVVGINFFAAVLPWSTWLAGLQGFDDDGRVLAGLSPRRPPRF